MNPVLLCILAGALSVHAAPPNLEALYPAGGQAGSTVQVDAVGKIDWPATAWCSRPELTWKPDEKEKRRYHVTIPADAKPGPCLVRLYNAEGASTTRIFVISAPSQGPELKEEGDHDNTSEAQVIPAPPLILNGKLEAKGNIDFFRLPLKKGQTLRARADCYALGSLADPFLHLLDARGYEIALASQSKNLDPLLVVHEIPADGDYFLQIEALDHPASSSVNFTAGDAKVYRLNLSLGDRTDLPAATLREAASPNPTALAIPCRLEGELSQPREVDRYPLSVKKGQRLTVRIEAQKLNFPVDAVLKINNPDGTQYKLVDDIRSPTFTDAEFSGGFPLEGIYTVEVSDRFHRGARGMGYHVVVEEPVADFKVTADKDVISLKPGGEAVKLVVKLERQNGHIGALAPEVLGLPKSVTATPTPAAFPEKNGDVTLDLKASAEAQPWNGPFGVRVSGKQVQFQLIAGDTNRGDWLINEHGDLWLTVLAKAEEPAKPAK